MDEQSGEGRNGTVTPRLTRLIRKGTAGGPVEKRISYATYGTLLKNQELHFFFFFEKEQVPFYLIRP